MSGAGQRRRLSNPESQAQYLYEVRGESTLALKSYVDALSEGDHFGPEDSLSRQHNLALLTYLTDTQNSNEQVFLTALKEMFSKKGKEKNTTQNLDKKGRGGDANGGVVELSMHQLVLAHNIALNAFFANNPAATKEVLLPIFHRFSDKCDDCVEDKNLGSVKCKIAFLLIDCILAMFEVDMVKDILDWIEKYISSYQESKSHAGDTTNSTEHTSFSNSYNIESATELKFRLHCCKSRYLFLESRKHHFDQTKVDSNSRLARKELKNAMEIYHHKISGKRSHFDSVAEDVNTKQSGSRADLYDGAASVQDSISPSIGSMSNDHRQDEVTVSYNGSTNTNYVPNGDMTNVAYDSRSPFEIKKSEAQHQHALYLKAHLEYLKGHAKKSLKLCSEVKNYDERQREADAIPGAMIAKGENFDQVDDVHQGQEVSDTQSAIYNNNIAVVFQNGGQIYLAMHYYALALSHLENSEKEQKAGHQSVKMDEDGTFTHISVSHILYNAAICAQQVGNYLSAYECMARCIGFSDFFSEDPRNWLHIGESCIGIYSCKQIGEDRWKISTSSDDDVGVDLNAVISDPLAIALDCLTRCLSVCCKDPDPNKYKQCLETARVSLAYIWMELNNPAPVVRLADLVLSEPESFSSEESGKQSDNANDKTNEYLESHYRRATVRIYACEAMCLLGNPEGGLRYLTGGRAGVELQSEVDRMANHLGGISIHADDKEGQDADEALTALKASIQMSISGANALIGNLTPAKEIAKGLIQMDASNEITGSAKKTLLYCLLAEGKGDDALQLVHTLR